MTVSHETNTVSYDGDDATSEFAFSFKVFDDDDIKVVATDTDGIDHVLPYGIYEHTVAGENGKFESGGTVSLLYDNGGSLDPWLIPTGWVVTLSIDMDFDQPIDLVYGGKYSSESFEKMVDRTVKMVQQLEAGSSNSGVWGIPTEATISSGIATLTGSVNYTIDTESDDASDALTQLAGLSNGDQVILTQEAAARDVVVTHGTYLKLAGEADFTLDNLYDTISLQKRGTVCVELYRATCGD